MRAGFERLQQYVAWVAIVTGDFETTSWGWRLQQFRQQIQEQLELLLSSQNPSRADDILPGWDIDLTGVAIFLGCLLVAWLVWKFWPAFRKLWAWVTHQFDRESSSAPQTQQTQMSVVQWRSRAREYQQRGDYREACRCLYLAMLQRLNDSEMAFHQSSRTDGEYRQLLQEQSSRQACEVLLRIHEQLVFGRRDATLEMFRSCESAEREFDRRLGSER
ncbi:MAG: DUF4129 domain-containing protein [Cyanobacteriota bacterium]|nr:DUF4129 domain-containing protein [Cyanobacteriota bacterium]